MAITPVALNVSVDETDATSYTTPSVSPSGGPIILLVNITGTTAVFNSVSGLGLTWDSLGEVAWGTSTSPTRRMRAYLGKGTPVAGSVTITTTGTATSCGWALIQMQGADPNSFSFGSSFSDTTTQTIDVPLTPLGGGSVFVSMCAKNGTSGPSVESGHTSLGGASSSLPGWSFGVAWHQTDNQATWSWTTAGVLAAGVAVIATEYAPPPPSGPINPVALHVGVDETDASSYVTPSVSPTAGPVLAFITVTGGSRSVTGVSGLGLAWVSAGRVAWSSSSSPTRETSVWLGTGDAVSSGTVSISVNGTATSCGWALIELVGADHDSAIAQIGTAVSDVAVQALSVPTSPLTALGTDSIFLSICAKNGTSPPDAESGHTSLGTASSAAPGWSFGVAWHQTDTQASWSWTTSAVLAAGIAVEIIVQQAPPPPPSPGGAYTFDSVIWGAGFQNVGCAIPGTATVLTGGDVAGVHRSTDYGSTWEGANWGMTSLNQRNTASLHVSPNDPSRIWRLGSGSNLGSTLFIMKSTDYGKTWSVVASKAGWGVQAGGDAHPRQTGKLILERPGDANRLLIGTGDGVKLSTDGGATWTNRALSGTYITSIAQDPNNSERVWVTADGGVSPGVWRLDNAYTGTVSATQVSSTLTDAEECVAIAVGASTVLYVAAGSGGIWSYDGTSWTNRTGSLNTSTSRWSAIDGYYTGSAIRLIAGCANPVVGSEANWYTCIVRSTDGGATWTDITQSANIDKRVNGELDNWWFLNYKPSLGLGKSTYDVAQLLIHPTDRSRAWSFGRSGVWRTNNLWDTTPSWHPVVRRLGVTIEWQVATHPSDTRRVAIGDTDWQILTTSNDWSSTIQNNPSGNKNGYAVLVEQSGPSAGKLWLGVGNRDTNTQGEVWSSSDWWAGSSATWQNEGWPVSNRVYGLAVFRDAANQTVVLGFGEAVGIYRKVGSGSWTLVASITDTIANKHVDFAVSPPYVWCYVPESGLWRSSDYGASWQKIWAATTSGRSVGYLTLDPWSATTVWVSRSTTLHRIRNAHDGSLISGTGSITNEVIDVPGLDEPGPLASHPSYGLVVADRAPVGPALYRTLDGGSTWTDVADDVYRGTAAFPKTIHIDATGRIWVAIDGNGTLRGNIVSVAPLQITTTSLPDGAVGTSYSATLNATGGSGTYTWSTTSFVPGLSLGTDGVLSGTPTTAGTYTVDVQVSDGSQIAAASLSLNIIDTATGPVTPPVLDYGQVYYIKLIAKDQDGSASPSEGVPGAFYKVSSADVEANAIGSDHVMDGAIATRHMASGSITGEKLSPNLIVTTDITLSDTGQIRTVDEVPFIRASGMSRGRVVKDAAQSIPNSTDTTITIGSADVVVDTDGYFVNNQIKIPFDGQYLIQAGGRWAADATGRRRLFLERSTDNGNTWSGLNPQGASDDRLPVSAVATMQSFTVIIGLRQGDRLRLRAYHNVDGGGALDLNSANLSIVLMGTS